MIRWWIVRAALPVPAAPAQARPDMVYHALWRSFAGTRQHFGCLRRLGATTFMRTLLHPSRFCHSPFADDFERIDPEFGTMADLRAPVPFNFGNREGSARMPLPRGAVRRYGAAQASRGELVSAPACSAAVRTMPR